VASSGEIANASGAERFIGALHRHGVRFMFGQSIPSRFYLATDDFGIKQIAYRTENAGAVMADAYSRVSGRVAVVTGQNGPAATLLVAGLAEALNASIPMVAMVQEVPRSDADRNAFQELDQLELFKGSCKWLKRVEDITRIDDYVDMAFTAAASGRPGPAVLLCPRDMIDLSSVPRSDRALSLGEYPLDRPVAETARIEEAAALLAGAERPLVYAGGGVHLSRATAELADLQEAAHLPVATTTMGKGGVDERHGLSLGVIGYYMGTNGATKFMRPLVDNADVIVLVGNRTNQNGTDSWTLLPKGARYIHIDIDGQEIGRNYEAMRLQGDAKATLEALTAALARHDLSKRAAARPQVEAVIAEAKAKHITEVAPLATSTAQPIRPERMMADVAKILTPEHIIVADASYASIWVCNNLRSLAPGMRFLTPRGMAGLGWGCPWLLAQNWRGPRRRSIAWSAMVASPMSGPSSKPPGVTISRWWSASSATATSVFRNMRRRFDTAAIRTRSISRPSITRLSPKPAAYTASGSSGRRIICRRSKPPLAPIEQRCWTSLLIRTLTRPSRASNHEEQANGNEAATRWPQEPARKAPGDAERSGRARFDQWPLSSLERP